MPLILPPDDVTAQAIRRLRGDTDFQRVAAWLRRALERKDIENRSTMDGVPLRQGQGAAATLAEVVEQLEGKTASTGALSDTARPAAGLGRSDT